MDVHVSSLLGPGGQDAGIGATDLEDAQRQGSVTADRAMAQRRPRIANEMLLPLSRTQLFDGLFIASSGNAARMWIIVNSALEVVTLASKEQVSMQTTVMFVILSAAAAFAAFGISMRVAIWPSMTKRLIALWVGCVVLVTPLILWEKVHASWGELPFIAGAVGLIGAGAVLLYAARRVWLNLEFA